MIPSQYLKGISTDDFSILDKLPKRILPKAKSFIHEMYQDESKKDSLGAYDHVLTSYEEKYLIAVKRLIKYLENFINPTWAENHGFTHG